MVEDPKAGTPSAAPDGSGTPAGTPGAKPEDSAAGAGATDDKDARLQKLEADLAAERELRLKHQDKVEQANRIIEEQRRTQGQSATDKAAPQADPLADLSEADIQELQALSVLPGEENRGTRAAAKAILGSLKAAVLTHDLTIRSNVEAAIQRAPKEDQKAVREAWESRRFRSVDDAAEHVRLSKLSPLEQENAALKKRIDEMSKGSSPSPPGTAPRGVGGGGAAAGDRKTITDSERARVMSEGSNKEQWDLVMAIRRGETRVVSD